MLLCVCVRFQRSPPCLPYHPSACAFAHCDRPVRQSALHAARTCVTDDACINYQINECNAGVSLNHARTRCKLHSRVRNDGRTCRYVLYRCDRAKSSPHGSTNCVRAMRCASRFGIATGLADSAPFVSLVSVARALDLPFAVAVVAVGGVPQVDVEISRAPLTQSL